MKIFLISFILLFSQLFLLVHCQKYNGRVLVLKGRLFIDTNRNTKYETNEPGFSGILVTPLDNAVDFQENRLQPFYSNSNGEFTIDGLKESIVYRFNFSNPKGYYFESYDIGLNCPAGKTCIRNAQPSDGYKGTIVVENVSGYEIPLIPDANAIANTSILCLKIKFDLPPDTPKPGFAGTAVVGNIFKDMNANGFKEWSEEWYSGIQLLLVDANGNAVKDANGNIVQKVTTDQNGRYVFENIAQGEYYLKIVGGLSGGYTNPGLLGPFKVNQGSISSSSDGVQSQYIYSLGNYGLRQGTSGCSNGSFYGYFFLDLNGNGVRDSNEKFYSGLELLLVDVNGNPIKDANGNPIKSITDANGKYTFDNIPSGQYYLKINGGLNGAFNPGLIGPFKFNQGSSSTNLGEYGLLPTGNSSCSGNVYLDLNFNLRIDGGEKGIGGVLIRIYAPVYNYLLFEVYTDANGKWYINGLYPGMQYRCIFIYINYVSTGQSPSRCINGGDTEINCGLATLQNNLGLGIPNYNSSQSNATSLPYAFSTSCFVKGESNGLYKALPTVIQFTSNATNKDTKTNFKTVLATHGQTGAVFGIIQRPETGDIFVSAYYKHGSGFGPAGSGGIYKIEKNGNVSTYADLNKIFGSGFTGPVAVHNLTYEPTETKYAGIYTSKVAFGELAISSRYLFVMNLFTNEIVQMPLADTPTASNTFKMKVNDPGCTFGDWRAFSIQTYKGQLWAGGMCSGEVGSELKGYILKLNTTTNQFDVALEIPFDYIRQAAAFIPWSSTDLKPQPIIAGFAFDESNGMAIAIRDRLGDIRDAAPVPDLLYACLNKYGDYALESNGKCNGRTGARTNANYGPGGGNYLNAITTRAYNMATSIAYAGSNAFIATGSDIEGAYNGGVGWIDANNGSVIQKFTVYAFGAGNYDKASGLGDIAPIYNSSTPISTPNDTVECGRIWFDCNGNGIQDCDEIGITGVTVYLYDHSNLGAPVAQTTSDAKGNFKFTVKPKANYSCVIPANDVQSKFGPFILSPLNTNPNFEYIDSDAQFASGNLFAGYTSPSYSGHIFTDCHFGIVDPSKTSTNGYGYQMSNGSCVKKNDDCVKKETLQNDF